MPLPAVLQARLKKRGIISEDVAKERSEENVDSDVIRKGCPNAVNPYHECTDYCLQRWGAKGKAKVKKQDYKLLPLPPGWFRVPDVDSTHDYYWNVHTNQVSWRHPHDPRAEVTYPASWQEKKSEAPVEADDLRNAKDKDREVDEKRDEGDAERKSSGKIKTGKHPSLLKAQKQREKAAPYRKGRGRAADDDPLDPMDPASYSDVGRGTWSTGLKEDSEVKTGVDTTANGPLYQQRPYPTPGEILRRNRKAQDAESF